MSKLQPLDELAPKNGPRLKRRAIVVFSPSKLLADAIRHDPVPFDLSIESNMGDLFADAELYGPTVLIVDAEALHGKNVSLGQNLPGSPVGYVRIDTNPENSGIYPEGPASGINYFI
jgi:hypothetical protein